ncbi:MAG TPA: polysaccharide deacetylase family protein [Thermoanaerobaculia bacterium]
MRNLIVGFAWLSPFVAIILWPHVPMLGLAIMASSHALLLYPTLRANVQWLGPVVTRFAPEGRQVWLTIDDGPTDDTPAILEVLAQSNVKATFFLKGALADKNSDLVRSIVAGGHSIGNHSHTHPSATFWCLPPPAIGEEIDKCNVVLGTQKYFRAPVGMKNPAVHPLLAERRMRLIGWTVRGFDTVVGDPRRVAARILKRVEPGAIIVMHQGRSHSVRCIERVIEDVRKAGYGFVVPADEGLKANR